MDENLKVEFMDYLSFMGILSKSKEQSFQEIYDNVSKEHTVSFIQFLSKSLALFLSKLSFEEFYKVAFDIVLRYSSNKVKVHLRPLQKALLINEKRNIICIRKKFIQWYLCVQSKHNEAIKSTQRYSKKIPKNNNNQFNISFKSNDRGSFSQSEIETNQNTTINNIIKLMKVNRIRNIQGNYSTRSQANKANTKEYLYTFKMSDKRLASSSTSPKIPFTKQYDGKTKGQTINYSSKQEISNQIKMNSNRIINESYANPNRTKNKAHQRESLDKRINQETKIITLNKSKNYKKKNKSVELNYDDYFRESL